MSLPPSQEISVPPGIPALLRDLIHEQAGLYFENDRLDTMIDKLQTRAQARGCRSFLDYYYILKYDGETTDEWRRVMDAFSVQETYFYREMAQVRALVDHVVPNWFRTSTQPLRIWSAACASGEEPYSLAIALKEAGWSHHPIEIRASDASESALTRAQNAIYRERSFRAFPPDLREKYFTASTEGWRLNRQELLPISFQRANLASPEDIAKLAVAEVIFCRNVFIYFSQHAIERTVANFAAHMPDRGNLFIGASESLLKLTSDFDLKEIKDAFVYVRKVRDGKSTP